MNSSNSFFGNDVTMVTRDSERTGDASATAAPHTNSAFDRDVTMRAPLAARKTGFAIGDIIMDRYVVEAELGRGGMGVVYLCFDKVGGIKVAVKCLPPELSHDSDEMEAVRDNFRLVSELQHSNIAGLRTLEKDPATGDYFLVMTYARGVSLKRWLREHSAREYRAEHLKILRQIAVALDYAHNAAPRHIIHRDIKPENVMVDEHGNAMVLDFGLAAQLRSSLSRVSQLVTSSSGTPAYKSPEQWLAQAQRAPSDQYSLGVIAYQMFAGALPFDSDDIEILKHAVVFDKVPKIRGEGKSVNAVFAKALAKKPQERFASCVAFVDALEGSKMKPSGTSSGAKLLSIIFSLFVFAGLCAWWVWESYKEAEAARLIEQQEQARRSAKIAARKAEVEQIKKRREAAEAERKRKAEEAEARRVAEEKAEAARKAEEARIAKEREAAEAERKRKAEEAEARRIAEEKAEAARKAEEARIAKEKAAKEAEQKRKDEEEKAQQKKLQDELSALKTLMQNMQKNSAHALDARAATEENVNLQTTEERPVSLEGRTSPKFRTEDVQTLSLLKFSSSYARSLYVKACELAQKGSHNRTRAKKLYDQGRQAGGPEWAELEAWLDWWR